MIDKYPFTIQFTKDNFGDYFKKSVVVFDSSVLLQFYKLTQSTREHVLKLLKHPQLSARLWLPSTIVEEYFKNRERVIRDSITRVENVYKQTFSASGLFASYFVGIKEDPESKSTAAELIQKEIDILSGYLSDDKVLSELDTLYPEDRVSEVISEDDLKKYKEEYKSRLDSKKETPGEEDQRKSSNKEGDFIIWKQLIAKAVSSKQNIIFVTRDRKSDLWNVINQDLIVEKFQLLKEFYLESGKIIRMFNDVSFFELLTRTEIISEDNKQTIFVLKRENESLNNFEISQSLKELRESMTPLIPNMGEIFKITAPNAFSPINQLLKKIQDENPSLLQAFQPFGGLFGATQEMQDIAKKYSEGHNLLMETSKRISEMGEISRKKTEISEQMKETAKKHGEMLDKSKEFSDRLKPSENDSSDLKDPAD